MRKVHFVDMKEFEDVYTPNDHEMLRISPNDYIYFQPGDNNRESGFSILNTAQSPMTYKIQTTSPEKFRVRPRCGVLKPEEVINVSIILKPEHTLSESSKDKFLVMGMEATNQDLSQATLLDLWKQKPTNSPEIEQHRIICQFQPDEKSDHGRGSLRGAERASTSQRGSLDRTAERGPDRGAERSSESRPSISDAAKSNVSDLSKQALRLERELRFTQTLQWVTLAFLIILSIGFVYLMKMDSSQSGQQSNKSSFVCPKGHRL